MHCLHRMCQPQPQCLSRKMMEVRKEISVNFLPQQFYVKVVRNFNKNLNILLLLSVSTYTYRLIKMKKYKRRFKKSMGQLLTVSLLFRILTYIFVFQSLSWRTLLTQWSKRWCQPQSEHLHPVPTVVRLEEAAEWQLHS
jgi:Ni,Fe-hydrogenase I cytochrome b subunit